MIFKTKGELLEYLGEDKKYVRLIDRMMVKWEVNKTPEWYEYIDKDREEIERLKLEVQRLSNEVEEVKREKMEIFDRYMESNQESSVNDDEIINKVYRYLTRVLHLRVDYDEFKEWIDNN